MKPSAVVCALLLGSLCVSVSMAESGYSYRDVDAPEGGAPPVPTQQDQEAPAPRQDQEGAGDGAPVPAKGSPLEIIAAPVPNRAEIASMDRDLAKKLSKMKELISGIHQGVDKSSKLRATSMKHKFNKLSAVIATLAGQKDALFQENVKLRREMRATVERLVRVESELKREARRADDNDLKRWFDVKAGEIAEFLHSSGLQNYEDPQFSPLVAGLVTYGLVLLPLLMASGYVTRHIKSLSLLHALMAINLFEVGYTGTTIVSMPLLGTLDPWHAMRHISDINFTFLQIVIACLFWPSVGLIVADAVRTRSPAVRRSHLLQLAVRALLAADYGRRVWAPVVERSDEALSVPAGAYAGYLCATLLARRLTASARHAADAALRGRDDLCRAAAPEVLDAPAPPPAAAGDGVLQKVSQMMPAAQAQHAD